MKLGESGEAFFVQECPENDLDELPENLATSPLPSEEYANKYNERYTVADTAACSSVFYNMLEEFCCKKKRKIYTQKQINFTKQIIIVIIYDMQLVASKHQFK